jgi:hypothetical protein
MFTKLRQFFARPEAKAVLPGDGDQPKVPSKQVVIPPFLGTSPGSVISDRQQNLTNLDAPISIRQERTLAEVVKRLVVANPDAANAVVTKINTSITAAYTVIAYDVTGRVDVQGTELAQSLARHWELGTYDPSRFTRSTDARSLSASLLYDSLRYGAMCLELVLGKGRLPLYLSSVPVRKLKWMDDPKGEFPVYVDTKGTEIPLNYPTIFYSSSIQDKETAYPDSPMMAAVQACLWDMEFVNDLRRAATKTLMPRLRVKIDTEKYKQTLPHDVQSDPAAMEAHMDATISRLEQQLNGLEPQDALVIFDILDAETIQDSNRSEDRSMAVLHNLINGKVSAGVKILPSVIGRGAAASSASTESLLYLKSISAVQSELNVLLSRSMTMALRLYGKPVYVEFKFKEVNLRPELELVSFRAIEQSSVLEQLSLGMTSDIEAVLKLTGTLPPVGYKNLSGTMFKHNVVKPEGDNNYSNTSVSPDGKPDSDQNTKDTQAPKEGVKSA